MASNQAVAIVLIAFVCSVPPTVKKEASLVLLELFIIHGTVTHRSSNRPRSLLTLGRGFQLFYLLLSALGRVLRGSYECRQVLRFLLLAFVLGSFILQELIYMLCKVFARLCSLLLLSLLALLILWCLGAVH